MKKIILVLVASLVLLTTFTLVFLKNNSTEKSNILAPIAPTKDNVGVIEENSVSIPIAPTKDNVVTITESNTLTPTTPIIGKKTEIITYKQTYVPNETMDGNCWSASFATPNVNALRCSSEHFIYDPCFITPTNQVVCDIIPESPTSGVLLNLTDSIITKEEVKYTPYGKSPIDGTHPFLMKLKNGFECRPIRGTANDIDGEWYFNFCENEHTVLLGRLGKFIDKTSQLWKVRVAYLSDDYERIEKLETVDVVRIWE